MKLNWFKKKKTTYWIATFSCYVGGKVKYARWASMSNTDYFPYMHATLSYAARFGGTPQLLSAVQVSQSDYEEFRNSVIVKEKKDVQD